MRRALIIAVLVALPGQLFATRRAPPAPLPLATPLERPPLPPLSPEQRALFTSVRADPAPESLVRGSHYWVSNEHSHYLWHPHIRDLGGSYIGVGTDQNYLLAAWAKSELLVLMDFDQAIADLHLIYACFFGWSSAPDIFLQRWNRRRQREGVELIRRCLQPISAERGARWERRLLGHFRRIQSTIFRRLRGTKRQYEGRSIPTFLSDQGQYDWIRGLWAGGRVLAIRGDLTATNTMRDLGRVLGELRAPLNVLYLSNAEQYFEYRAQFRRNMISQSWGPRSLILRTLGWRVHGYVDEDEGYHYNLQSGQNMSQWMERSRVLKLGRLLRHKTPLEPAGFSRLQAPPVEGRRPPEIAP